MNFLQPWMLWALPLAVIPVVIHLINQRRYQTTQWAAMMFLLAANRMNRGYTRIRQWAILLFRMLVIAALIMAIGRPLVSGSLSSGIVGSLTGQTSDNVIVLVDRSPSMHARDADAPMSKLETGLTQMKQTFETLGINRLTVIESNQADTIEIESPEELLELPQATASDASADVPGMMLTAIEYIQTNQLGKADIWVCSDLRDNDWRSADGRWETIRQTLVEMGPRIRLRVLGLSDRPSTNASVRVVETESRKRGDQWIASLSLDVREDSDPGTDAPIPVTFEVDENRWTVEVPRQPGGATLDGYEFPLSSGQTRGWGKVSIPQDANPGDDEAYFTIDSPPPYRTVVVTRDQEIGRVLELAAGIPTQDGVDQLAQVVSPDQLDGVAWEEAALVLWQAALDQADVLQTVVDRGGAVMLLPPSNLPEANESSVEGSSDEAGSEDAGPGDGDASNEQNLSSFAWTTWQTTTEPEQIGSWRGDAGLLSNTRGGAALPMDDLAIRRWASFDADATVLAELSDGSPLVARLESDSGNVYVCATTPRRQDSSLAYDGVVLYVMIQRAIAEGADSLGTTRQVEAGDLPAEVAQRWQRLLGRDAAVSTENAFTAGVYADETVAGEPARWIAVNRPASEDALPTVQPDQLEQLLRDVSWQLVDRRPGSTASLVEEIWRLFLIVMLVALISEAWLSMPRQVTASEENIPGSVAA